MTRAAPRRSLLWFSVVVSTACGGATKQPHSLLGRSTACISAKHRAIARASPVQLRPHPRGGVYVCLTRAWSPPFPVAAQHCWHLDRRGGLHASDVPTTAGRELGAGNKRRWELDSTSHRHRAVLELGDYGPRSIRVVDATGKAATGDLMRPPIRGKHGGVEPDATTRAVFFVHDTLLIRDSDSGPHEDVIAYSMDGRVHNVLISELSGGTISVVDQYRVIFADHEIGVIQVYDTRTRMLSRYERALSPVPACTDAMEQYTVCTDKTPAAQRCCAQLKVRNRWSGSLVAPLGRAGTFAVIATGARFGKLGVLDADKRAITRVVDVSCPAN